MCYEIAALYAAMSQEDKAKVDAMISKLLNAQRPDTSTREKEVTV